MTAVLSKKNVPLWAVALLLLFTVSALGQERFGTLVGVVTDPSKAVLPDVTVTVTNKETNRATVVKTRGDGTYTAPDLEPGRYVMVFEKVGFSRFEVPDVLVIVGKTLKVDAQMKLGALEQTVQVSEAAPLIDTGSTAIAHDITSEEFDRMPKGRSFQTLIVTSPSVNSGDIEGGFQVNGASAAENQFVIDGISTNSLIHGQSRENAPFEFLQEIQIKTGGISAEYGGAMGGVISAVTKSGGNAFHGDVHYYYYGNAISASPVKRLLLDPKTQVKASYVQDDKQQDDSHEPGYSLGGYFIKDKLWFFSSASPRYRHRANDITFTGQANPVTNTFSSKLSYYEAFNKISLAPTSRVRMNFGWLWSPFKQVGTIPAYNYGPNQSTTSLASNEAFRKQGFLNPQTNYTGQVDITLSSTALLTIRGARFWDDYKSIGVPAITSVTYQKPTSNLPPALQADIPPNLVGGIGFYNTPRTRITFHDLATRTYGQADFSQFFSLGGSHNLKLGVGLQKNVNNVDISYPGGFVYIYWGASFTSNVTGITDTGKYGYYEADNQGTRGSVGATMVNMYINDNWRIHPRLTLNLGLRTENESIPSFRRDYLDPAFKFNFQDKLAPRLGATLDVFGNGKMKVYGSWGLYYDWVKYELSRGTFGGDVWTIKYRSLDTTDVFSLSYNNAPGRNLWSPDPNSVRDRRVPSFKGLVDPNIKPMSTALINAGIEYQIRPQTVVAARYVHNGLRRTIEDLGALVNGDEVYAYVNPGEGMAKTMAVSGATCSSPSDPCINGGIPTPKPKRDYDALELTLTRRFSNGWFASASYVFSRLYGNYPGLWSSDEILAPTTGVASATAQQNTGSIARAGTSGSRAWDLDEYVFDSHGHLDVLGRLQTDRPHVFKFYGSKRLKWGTEIGGWFEAASGTPLSTFVNTINQIEVFVNGRGDLGRTPVLTQTDLMVAHEFKVNKNNEAQRLRFEFNGINIFNQKTPRYKFTDVNRGAGVPVQSSAIVLSNVDLFKGYDYMALIAATPDAKTPAGALDPRFGMWDLWNAPFAGRFGVKFLF